MCSILLAASQRMMTVWSALTTSLPDGGAGQQPGAIGVQTAGASKSTPSKRKNQLRVMVSTPRGEKEQMSVTKLIPDKCFYSRVTLAIFLDNPPHVPED